MKNSMRKRIASILAGVMILSLVFVNPTIVKGSETSDTYEMVIESTTLEDGSETEEIDSAETTVETMYSDNGLDEETADSSTETVIETSYSDTEETIESYAADDTYEIATLDNEESNTEDDITEDDTLKEPRKVSGTVSVEIDGEPVDPDTKTDVKNGTSVNIQLNFKIPNSYNLQLNDHCYYDLPIEGLNLTKGEGIIVDMGKILGEWKYDNESGRLEFWFTDEEFLSKSNITGDIDIDASINLAAIDLDDNGDGEIKIGDTYYDIHVNDEDRLPEVTATKSIGQVEFDQTVGKVCATYTLTIKALADTENVHFEDIWGENLSLITGYAPINIESTINGNMLLSDLSDYKLDSLKEFSGTISSMKAGEVITITYKAFFDRSMYYQQGGYDKDKLTNTLNVTDRFGNGPGPQTATVPDGSISVAKTGTYNEEDSTVTWTITIKNPHKVPISNITLVDEPSNQWSDIYESLSSNDLFIVNGIPSIPILALFSSNSKSISCGAFLSTDVKDCEEEYVISYTFTVKDEYKKQVGLTDENKVTLKYGGDAINAPGTAMVGIGPENYLTEKNGKLVSGNKIDWTITFEVPTGGLEDVKLHDTYDNTMQLDVDTVQIIGPDNMEFTGYSVREVTTDSDKDCEFEIEFTASPLPEGTYTITYTTDLNQEGIMNWTKVYNNNAYVVEGTINQSPLTGKVDLGDQMKKYGVTASSSSTGSVTSYGTTVQDWRLEFPKFSEMKGTNYRIQDVWETDATNPFQYEYVPGSIRAHKVANGYHSDNPDEIYVIDDVEITFIDNGIEFNITDAIQYAKDKGWTSFYITYQTKIADEDMDAFLDSYDSGKTVSNQTGYSVQNRARLLEGDDPFGVSNTVKATSKPRAVVDKVGTYNDNTVPYAKYKISVNPGGNDLLKGQDQLVLKDTLPEDFMLVEDSLKVYYATIGSAAVDSSNASVNPKETALMPTSEWSYDYDPIDNILTITIPDETEVIITYDVSVEKKAGTVLDGSNACNSAELVGVTLDSAQDNFTVEGVVLGSGATASSTTATLNVYKASAVTKDLLSGAEFSIRMIDYNVDTGEISEPESTPQGYKGPVSFTTEDDGYYIVKGLYFDKLYEMTETKAPDGFIKDDTPRYIVFIGHDNENFDEERDKVNYPEGTEFYELDSKTIIIENEEMWQEETSSTETTTERTETTTEITSETTEVTTEITSVTTEITTEITSETTELTTEITSETTDITTEITTETTDTTTETQTKTGDSAPIGTVSMIMFLSAAVVVFLKRKKQNIS